MKLRKISTLIILLMSTSFYAKAQGSSDLILTGSNSWIFHTPDDGRSFLHIAPFINGDWNWNLISFTNTGILTTIGLHTKDLVVNGNVRAKEIKVEVGGTWPDYVFKPEYQLTSLTETEQFIKKNGHLPDIPKASEIEANGLSLGEMNKLMMKKIEELTLHLIEKDKEMKEYKQLLIQQADKLKCLESRLK
ncbi:hypothetical protein [Sphingobacterium faecium]